MFRGIALALALMLAGCFASQPEEEVGAASVDEPSVAAMTASGNVAAIDPTWVPKTFRFEYEGTTSLSHCLPAGPGSCVGALGTSEENTFFELDDRGPPVGVVANLTWSATTPATEEMIFRASVQRDCRDECTDEDFQTMEVRGASPLSIVALEFTFEEGDRIALSVELVSALPEPQPPLVYSSSLPQEFAVEGTLVALVPPR